MHLDLTEWKVRVFGGVVNQGRYLALSHFAGTESKNKQEGIDHVGLARSVRSDNRGE